MRNHKTYEMLAKCSNKQIDMYTSIVYNEISGEWYHWKNQYPFMKSGKNESEDIILMFALGITTSIVATVIMKKYLNW